MKKLFLLLLAVFSLTSCNEKTSEELVKDAFMNYVQTDFDDPSEFQQITSIEPIDTLSNKVVSEIIKNMEETSILFSEYNRNKLADYKSKFDKDKTFIVTYEVKVRIKRNSRKSILIYYVIDDGLNYKVQDHRMNMDEAPELYSDFYNFASDLID